MSRLPPSAKTHVNEAGLILADEFNDSYFSRDDGLEESRTVFLEGCGLPEAWLDRSCFIIGELGFGTGLNVLAVWDLWIKTRPKGGVLHIITVEGFLLDADAAKAAHQQWPELAHLSEQLIAQWPTRAYGAQRVWLPHDGLCITFLIGPCEDVLSRMDFQADCWFLDGFSPARNPDMWSIGVFAQIARLSTPQARLATYSVAGVVKFGLAQQGFDVRRMPGFGSKRERLEAQRPGINDPAPPRPQSAIVIGGGITGSCVAAALLRRDIKVHIFDDDPCGRTKASGNPVALIMPRLDRADTRVARFFKAAYLMALNAYNYMSSDAFAPTGVDEVSHDDPSLARLHSLALDPPLPEQHLSGLDGGCLTHHMAGLAYPYAVLKHLKLGATHHPITIARVVYRDNFWTAYSDNGAILAKADMCVIANGPNSGSFCGLAGDLRGRTGQLSWTPVQKEILPMRPRSGGAYAAPFGENVVFGATYEPCDLPSPPPAVSIEAHARNRDMLAIVAPDLASQIDLASVHGRASVRVTTNDNMPVVGRVSAADDGLFVITALGSRGFTTAFLCAELIACQACNEPVPVEQQVALSLAPDRFSKRALRRRRAHAE